VPAPPPPPPPPPDRPAAHASSGAPAGAWVAFSVGGVLAAGSIVSFALRASNLRTMNHDCQSTGSGTLSCPTSLSDTVNRARQAALVEGPLGIGLAAGAVVSAGIGVWLVASQSGSVQVGPAVTPSAALLVFRGTIGP
jgi:hypothetical protein